MSEVKVLHEWSNGRVAVRFEGDIPEIERRTGAGYWLGTPSTREAAIEMVRLAARVAALEAGLQRIAHAHDEHCLLMAAAEARDDKRGWSATLGWAQDIAKAALDGRELPLSQAPTFDVLLEGTK